MKQVCQNPDQARTAFGKFMQAADWQKPYMLEFKLYKRPKTSAQNARMHAMWREVALHVGRTEDEIKAIFKQEYGPEKVVKLPDGNSVRVIKGTSEYTREECSNMIEQIYRKGAEWSVPFSDE